MIPEWEFKAHGHTALLAHIMASALGGAKDSKFTDYLLGYARMGDLGQPNELQLRLKGKEAADFRLALKKGCISQRMLNYMVA